MTLRSATALFFCFSVFLPLHASAATAYPAVSLAETAIHVSESAGTVTLHVLRSGDLSLQSKVSIQVNASGPGRPDGSDYDGVPAVLTFEPGEASQDLPITIVDDAIYEPEETLTVYIYDTYQATIGAPASANITIADDDPAALLGFGQQGYTTNEGAGTLLAQVLRSGATNVTSTVHYAATAHAVVTSRSATPSADFTAVSGTLIFAPGETVKTIAVPILEDTTPEFEESFDLTLSNVTNGALVNGSVLVSIVDDDTPAHVDFVPGVVRVDEGAGSATLTLARSVNLDVQTTVHYRTVPGTASELDYLATAGNLTFASGETVKTVQVPIFDDVLAEGDEYFFVAIGSEDPTAVSSGAVITIADNDSPATPPPSIGFAASTYSASETAGSVTLTVQHTGDTTGTSSVTIATSNGTALAGSDYVATSSVLTFAPGETAKSLPIAIVNDGAVESTETFTVTLSSPVNATLGGSSTTVSIADDDQASTYRFGAPVYDVAEGTGVIVLTVIREGNTSTSSTVTFATCCASSSAAAGVDYAAANGTLFFAQGETIRVLSIVILDDRVLENDESFEVHLVDVPASPATIRIHDHDAPLRLLADDVSVLEGDDGTTQVTATLRLTAPLAVAFGVSWWTADGSAVAPADYIAAQNYLTFQAGETTKHIVLTVRGDRADEGDEYFTLNASGGYYTACCGWTPLTGGAAITIRNDDSSFSVADATVNEGDGGSAQAKFTVRLSVPLAFPASVSYTTLAGSAQFDSDFTGVSGTLTFAPGETSKEVAVPVIGDRVPEPNETFFLRLANATGAPISRAQAKGTIVNDDAFFIEYDGLEYAGAGKHALALDLYVPAIESETPYPLVVWIHGDHWMDGSRAATPAIREANRGYAVASIDYRNSDAAAFPAQIDDAKAAIRWLRANAARFHLDPDRVAAWGFGSGAHLAALLGTSGGVAELEDLSEGNAAFSSRVQLVVDWAGPIDLLQLQNDALPCSTTNHDSSGSYESLLLGCSVQRCAARAASASPSSYVTADDAAFLVMHGRADCEVGPAQSESFARLLRASHLDTTLKLFDDAGHTGSFWDTEEALGAVDAFLDAKLKAPPRRRAMGR